ncbi:MAG: CDP-2,3-bis-(O-geranylgeranyl)-sn-glycerol synthase [Candidatus Diapherotrites archaeon]|nr:CDP-2,3-bis-(O-geranylgeranyl)-sn-glycerol synthase [Candidatus Diapherotrites archaeon]
MQLIANALWYILPAYVANGSAVILKGNTPIDQGIKFVDGRPLFGRGKTVKGFILSVILGTAIGAFQALVSNDASIYLLGFLLALGAMVGDTFGSFMKRRFNLKRGEAAPLLDQWDFIFGALFFNWIGTYVGIPFPEISIVLTVLVMTAFLHVLFNYAAFKLKLKKEPW